MKSMLSIVILALMGCFTAAASDLPYFYVGDPTVIVKVAAFPSSSNTDPGVSAVTVELETGVCDKYKNCYNPFVIGVKNANGSHTGVGVDYVFKMFKRSTDALRLSAGVVAFDTPLNGDDEAVAHVGISLEAYSSKDFGAMVTIDHFDSDEPIDVFGLGFHFR